MLKKKDPSILNLALLVSLSITSQAIVASTLPVLANAASSTTLDAKLAFDSSSSTFPIAQSGDSPSPAPDNRNQGITSTSGSEASESGISAWWWLLPLGLLGLLIWWLRNQRSQSESSASPGQSTYSEANVSSAAGDRSEATATENPDPALRAEAVVHSDRAAIAETQSTPNFTEATPEIPEATSLEITPVESVAVDNSTAAEAATAEITEDAIFAASAEATETANLREEPSLAELSASQSEVPTLEANSSIEPLSTLDVIEELNELEAKIDEAAEEMESDQSPTVLDLTEGGTFVGTADLFGETTIASEEPPVVAVLSSDGTQIDVEAAKFNVGQADLTSETLATVDQGLADLPDGYGESRIVLLPRDPQWAYAYWDVSNEHKMELRQQGGQRLALRLYDVTDVDVNHQSPHSLQQFDCDELAREWYVSIPVSDRDYFIEIGYLTANGHWLTLARSAIVRVPPVYPSEWFEDQFVTIDWDEDLRAKTFLELIPPGTRAASAANANPVYEQVFDLAQGAEIQRVAGSLFGSMQQVPQQAISSFIFPSGVGGWALPTPSGMGLSGISMSGIGMSGAGLLTPPRPRRFWLVADAELIVYGATEPDATVTIAGQPIKLNPDGTFRLQMSFQDGLIDYPILAVAADNEQTRSIHLKFNRETPHRHTNTQEEATDEWF